MQSRINKEQEKYLLERNFGLAAIFRQAIRIVFVGRERIRQSVIHRRSGWAWHAQSLENYGMLGRMEGLTDPLAAYVNAEVAQWGTPQ